MEAIAHSPSFAKKAGVPQSVGKDYAAADKGKKFAGGGRAVINKQDTKHGKMDMPFNKLNRFAGMKAGGMMKKGRTFAKGGHLESLDDSQSFKSAFAEARNAGAGTFTWRGKKYGAELAKPTASPKATPTADTPENVARRSLQSIAAPNGRARTRSDDQNISAPFGSALKAETAMEKRNRILGTGPNYEAAPGRARTRLDEQNIAAPFGSAPLADSATMKRGGKVKRFAKGGMMKESKAMVGKEVAFMKKKGAPKSMIKHEAAEMGAMKKGGMAKYMTFSDSGKPAGMKPVTKMAKGGGIESRGKTKGMMVKMATGGVVKFAKGGGIESKGKTKGTMIKMQGC
jgi:hypothetical protein